MLKLANNYKTQIDNLFQEMILDSYYEYYSTEGHGTLTYKPKDDTWGFLEMVSVDSKDNLCGYMIARFQRPLGYVSNLGLVHKKDTSPITFAKDARRFFFDLMEKYGAYKISWSVNIGNPAEKIYDKFSLGNRNTRVIGVYFDHDITISQKICDSKIYEYIKERK